MPALLTGWKEAIKDSELPYREAKASIGNLRQCPSIFDDSRMGAMLAKKMGEIQIKDPSNTSFDSSGVMLYFLEHKIAPEVRGNIVRLL